ncbi:MAG: hypothetical protein ACYS15_14150 [Planctomycetota bacterium]|jgi:hypothetical protein
MGNKILPPGFSGDTISRLPGLGIHRDPRDFLIRSKVAVEFEG